MKTTPPTPSTSLPSTLRIGMLCYPTYGGSGAVATELGRRLAQRGHTIHFISSARPFRLDDTPHPNVFFHEIHSETYPLFPGQLYTLAAAVRIRDLILQTGLDVVHVHYALPHALSAWLAMEMLPPERRVPVLTTLHGTDITLVGARPSFAPAVRLGLVKSDALTCVSNWLAGQVGETCCDDAISTPLRVIYNFVDPEVFTPEAARRAPRKRYARADERIVIHVSNLRPVKRIGDVIEVFARIRRRGAARLLMVGDGPKRGGAVAHIARLGLDNSVDWLGRQTDVAPLLAMADVLLLPSDAESFGLVALEAMACGTPVVGSRAGGLPEVVEDGHTGFLKPVGDVEGMAEAASALLDDDALRQRISHAARAHAVERFPTDRIVPQYETAYNALRTTPNA